MASAELIIAFGAKLDGFEGSLKRVNQSLDQLRSQVQQRSQESTQSAEQAAASWNVLAGTFTRVAAAYAAFRTAVAAASGTAQLIAQSSDLTGSYNRLVIQLGGLESVARTVFGNMLRIATQSGVAFQDVAENFTRFSVALQSSSIPVTTQQITQLVETLTRLTQLSGSSQGGNAAIYQLSQGLASGRLQGEELKSILENMPMLAQALSRELGVTVGRLREMGSEGRLTAEVVFPALLRAGEALRTRMTELPLTVSQAWEATKNQFIAAVNAIDRQIGASSNIVAFLGGLQSMLGAIRRGAGGSTPEESRAAAGREEIRTQRLINEALREQTRIQEEINVAQRANLDTSRLYQALEVQNQTLVALGYRAEEQALERIVEGSRSAMDAETERFRSRQTATENARQNFRNEANELRRQNDERFRIQDDARRERERLESRWDAIAADRRTAAERLEYTRALAAINRQEQEQLRALERREGAQGRAAERAAVREQTRINTEAETLRRRLMSLTYPGEEFSEQMRRNTVAVVQMFADVNRSAQAMTITMGLVDEQAERMFRRMIDMGVNPREAFQRIREELERMRAAISVGPSGDPGPGFVERGLVAAERALDRFRIKFQTWQDLAREGIQQFSKTAADAIVDFATGADQNFTKMAEDFAKSIAKMILNAMIFRAIMLGLNAAFPGMGLLFNIPGRQSGGPVTAGQPYVVGEQQPELFVPGSSGYIVPSVPGGGGTTVNVYNNAPGTRARVQEKDNGFGAKDIEIFIEEVVGRGIVQGRYDQAMQASYGAFRLGRV